MQLGADQEAAAGLTWFEPEDAFSMSLIRHGRLAPDVIFELMTPSPECSMPWSTGRIDR